MINLEKQLKEMTEQKLYQLMKKRYPYLIDLNEQDKSSKIDWFNPDDECWMEGKCRSRNLLSVFIQKDKWDILKQKEKSYYVNSTLDGIYMWNIQDIEEPLWREQSMEESQEFKSSGRVKKLVGDLHTKHAMQIDHLLFTDM